MHPQVGDRKDLVFSVENQFDALQTQLPMHPQVDDHRKDLVFSVEIRFDALKTQPLQNTDKHKGRHK